MANRKTNRIVDAVRETEGRFFGLRTADGRIFNAQLVKETPQGIRVFDRNKGDKHLVMKSNISSVTTRGRTISV